MPATTPPVALDLAAIRAEFPALAQDFVFLDNAGGSQVLTRVADRVRDYLLTSSVQLGASYGHSQAAGAKVLEARQSVARLINAAHDEEVVMGGATTPPRSSSTANEGHDLLTARYLFEAADYVGRLSVAVQRAFSTPLQQAGASGEASFILGGQIAGQPHGLYMIYPQGNAIMATPETPFLQIGESKDGKPPLDYVGHTRLSLEDAARLCLVSQIVTRRSNLTVGPPFEIALVPADELRVSRRLKLDKDHSQVTRSMEIWARNMQETLNKLPRFAWEEDPL